MKLIDGYYWPSEDIHCHSVVPKQVQDLDYVEEFLIGKKVAVQAGGNVGIWPNRLKDMGFEIVHTFEPDQVNFACLEKNIKKDILFYNYGLSDKSEHAGLVRDVKNVGAHYVGDGDDINLVTIDSLRLEDCNLIVLDIEGYEPLALEGAKETIEKFKPVLMIEDKGLSEKYGYPKGWTKDIIGYKIVQEIHRDVILVPDITC